MPTSTAQVVQITVQTWQAIAGAVVLIFGIGAAYGSLRNEIKNLAGGLNSLKNSFDSYIQGLAIKAATQDGRTSSPFVPSEAGFRLLNESGATSLIGQQSFKDWFFPLVDKLLPKANYEVEQKVFSVLLQSKDDAQWNSVKEFIFKNPVYDGRPLTVERLMAVVSWVLRDEYIKLRKVGVSEV